MKSKKVEEYYISPIKSYSLAFKHQVVREVEWGLMSKDGAKRKYAIGGKTTVLNGCRKYGVPHKKEYRNMKVSRQEVNRQESEKEKIQELECALAEAHLKIRSQEIMLDMMRDDYGIDVRKKCATKHRGK